MRRLALSCLTAAALLSGAPLQAAPARERIVADLSHSRVAITADFVGSEILIYGAVKRDTPAPEGPLSVIITVEGPPRSVTLLQKARHAGLWVNSAQTRLPQVPSFYAVASSGFLQDDLSAGADDAFRISLRSRLADALPSEAGGAEGPALQALARLGAARGVFAQSDGAVRLAEDTLFRADIALPAQLIEGDYIAKIYLTRDGEVIDWLTRKITVRKTGIERAFTQLARENPLAYGLLTLALAAGAGSAASAFAAWRRG